MQSLIEGNKAWADSIKEESPDFFENLSKGQSPDFLWIGCSDSRVPATQLCGKKPGDLFVHRNIANLVVASDKNLESVIQYAVSVLKVRHIILCGHYGCGGVAASLGKPLEEPINSWIQPIRDTYKKHQEELDSLPADSEEKINRLVELNVQEQVHNLHQNASVQDAWKAGQELKIRGLVYDLKTGELKDLGFWWPL